MDSSWINLDLRMEEDKLIFNIKNSKHLVENPRAEISGGIGLQNLQNRLKLIYKENYTFSIDEKEASFGVQLRIKTES